MATTRLPSPQRREAGIAGLRGTIGGSSGAGLRRAWLLAALLSILLAGLRPAAAETLYRFGVVPQFEPQKLFAIWRPILDRLEARTGFKFEMVGSPQIPAFEIAFMRGDFDFAYMNPYHAMLASERQGYEPLVRDGGRRLFGIVVVSKDSPMQKVEELEGLDIAFPAPNALGASLLTRADLARLHGVSVKPLYVQTHSSVYLHVALGLTQAGGGIMSTLKRQAPEVRDQLRVLYKTRDMTPHPVTAHPRVPQEHRERVRRALIELGMTEEGTAMLAKVPIRKAVAASLEDYVPIKEWGLEAFYVEAE
jgi:phosphonate transport system substrate-binding protein